MSFTFRPAKRESVGLLLGLAGGTGSGKTYSALRIARGLAGDQPFALIDTENGRAKHYGDMFQPWHHGELVAPFRPERYAEAIAAADSEGYPVIVVDSASHEHAGEGGLLDWHDEEFQRMGGNDRVKMAAWIKPKMAHKAFVSRLLQVRAHVILCFRAEEKIEIVKDAKGKTEIRPKQTLTGLAGWVPICEKSLPFELTLSVLLTPDSPGVPKPIKIQEQHKPMISLSEPLTETAGERLAEWARGSTLPEPEGALKENVSSPGRAQPSGSENAETLTAIFTGLLNELGMGKSVGLIAENREKNAGDEAAHVEWLRLQIAECERIRDREAQPA